MNIKFICQIASIVVGLGLNQTLQAQPFVHPGCLSTLADFARMNAKVVQTAQTPWTSSWNILIANSHAQPGYVPNPQVNLVRGIGGAPCNVENYSAAMNDAAAAYQLSLRWRINGDTACANTAINILNAWSSTLVQICGDPNYALNGIYGYEFACAGENMRGYSGWSGTDFARFQSMMANKFYPMSHDFLVRHQGACISYQWANWDLIEMADEIAIGVVCDNRAFYNDAVNYFYHGSGNGRIDYDAATLTGTVVAEFNNNTLGEQQESGRDQGHSGLETSLEGVICTIAQNQGDNLFGYNNNKVMSLCEYFADYNLGNTVPYTSYSNCQPTTDATISSSSRGDNRPSWDLLYNQFVNRMNASAPFSTSYAVRLRPEGGGGNYGSTSGGFDQLGFTTLTHTIDKIPIASGNYNLINRASGLALDNAGSTSSGSSAIQWAANNGNNQHWAVTYLNNGYYQLTCATGNKCLDSLSYTANGAPAGQWTKNKGFQQQWMIVPVGSYYKIVNAANGQCLDSGGLTTNGAVIQQWGSGGSINQQWSFTAASSGGSAPTITSVTAGTVPAGTASGTVGSAFSYTITATGSPTSYGATGLPSGLSVNTVNGVISGTPTASGTFLVTLSANTAAATGQATLAITIAPAAVSIANGTYRIINRNSGQALDVVGANTANGAQIDQWSYSGANNQRWTVTSLGGGKYKIIGVASGRSLDISGGYGSLEIWDYNGGVNQQWIFTATSGGYYYITSGDLGSQFGLEVPGSSMSNGTLLDMWSINGGNNQQWILQAP